MAGYDKRTKTCYLSDDDPLNVFDIDDEMIGVFYDEMTDVNYYEPEVTGTIHVVFDHMIKQLEYFPKKRQGVCVIKCNSLFKQTWTHY